MNRATTVVLLGTAQTLAWASSYYLPAMLAPAMARDLGLATSTVFAFFSMALVVSALAGPAAGRLIDRHGGHRVLLASNALFVGGLVVLALAQGPLALGAGWLLLGLAMGCGLYDAAFAALVRMFGAEARQAITGITLIAGFASTVGWPLSTLFQSHWGWRGACLAWALLHAVLAAPLNAMLPRAAAPALATAPAAVVAGGRAAASPPTPGPWVAPLLATLFALMGFVSTSMAAHLPEVLQAAGTTLAVAVLAGALLGPAQVAARALEFSLLRRLPPQFSARAAALSHPAGAALLLIAGPVAALPFALLHGAGNGLLTIVRGTLPLALFGASGYGARQGWIAFPGRALGALSPWLFGLVLERFGARALWLSGSMCLAAYACLLAVPMPARRDGR